MHEQLAFTALLNKLFAAPVNALLNAIGIHPHDPNNPITDPYSMQILVALIMLAFFAMVRMRLSAENPGKVQHLAEMFHEFVAGQAKEIIGHHHNRYLPYVITVGLFILIGNLIGLIPGFLSPTQFPAIPLGCALCTFVYYNFHGLRQQGPVHYIKHFGGPIWWISPLMFPIEVISHTARIMSLTVRLFANMFAGEMVTLAFFSLIPVALPIIFLGLHIFVSFVQTFVFILLTIVYLGGAVAEEEH